MDQNVKTSISNDKMIIRYEKHFYRNGSISYIGVIDEEDYDMLQTAIKENFCIYLSDILGKHSEIKVQLSETDIEIITRDQEKVAFFEELFSDYIGDFDLVGRFRDKIEEERWEALENDNEEDDE